VTVVWKETLLPASCLRIDVMFAIGPIPECPWSLQESAAASISSRSRASPWEIHKRLDILYLETAQKLDPVPREITAQQFIGHRLLDCENDIAPLDPLVWLEKKLRCYFEHLTRMLQHSLLAASHQFECVDKLATNPQFLGKFGLVQPFRSRSDSQSRSLERRFTCHF